MGSPVIVEGKEAGEPKGTLDGSWIGPSIGPAAEKGLDEAFGFSIGARAVGACSEVTETESSAGRSKTARAVARAVIGHDASDWDAMGAVPSHQSFQEGGRGRGSFIGLDLGIGQTGSIIDGDVDEFPAGASGLFAVVAGDAMTNGFDTGELLGVDVDEFSRAVTLVAANQRLGIEVLKPREAFPRQDAGHGGGAGADPGGDLESGLAPTAQPQDFIHDGGMGLSRGSVRPGAAIDQRRLASLPITFLPFRSGSAVNTCRFGGAGRGHAGFHSLNHQESTGRASSGILVKLHLGFSFDELLALDTSSLTEKSPDGQLPPGNNVLRDHS